ncbi:MAG: alpha/beta hydrolase [Pseudomonadota bacterium]|uniref:alpha/beta hydrolase n=1 Tax=Gallaecimonas pentaromativorans TaxID=584787 RepID=UPI00067F5E6B|nr:alpha/beta hydrolase [Gallaecimonas pentaromativorans]MED5526505.1 alpha/beta hydrolase [Pseudomonadota bacterium]
MKGITKILAASALALTVNSAFAAATDTHTERQVAAFLKALNSSGGKPMQELTPKEARAVLTGAQKGAELPPADVTTKVIHTNGKDIKLVIVRPQGSTGDLPAFMFFHGGGWILGDYPTHERLIRDLVVRSGDAAVYVDYTPSPEAHYPVAINQAYDATKWVAEHGKEIGVDGSKLAVAGNSVGGNMAAVVSLMAKDKGTPHIRFQLLLWPVTDANFDTGSYKKYAEGYFLTRPMMKWFWDAYTTNPKDRAQIYASPLRASIKELKGLPPALIQTAEEDVLRDEGEAYGRKLNAAGVDVTSVRYNGLIHDFGLLNALADVPEVEAALDQAGTALKEHLK